MLFPKEPSHPYFLPLVERTIVGLPHPFGKLFQGVEFSLLRADWGFTLCTTQVRRIVALIICITFFIGNLRQWGHVHNPSDICFLWFRRWQESFRWEANGRSPRCAGRRSRWRSRAGRCLLQGFLIPIINTTFIELSTTAYLRNSFFPRLILRLNLLQLCCKSDQSVTAPKTVSSIDVNYTSSSNNHPSENSSNGNASVFRYLSSR